MHHLQAMKIICLKSLLFFMFKVANLAENLRIWRKIFLKVELRGVHGVCFFQVCHGAEGDGCQTDWTDQSGWRDYCWSSGLVYSGRKQIQEASFRTRTCRWNWIFDKINFRGQDWWTWWRSCALWAVWEGGQITAGLNTRGDLAGEELKGVVVAVASCAGTYYYTVVFNLPQLRVILLSSHFEMCLLSSKCSFNLIVPWAYTGKLQRTVQQGQEQRQRQREL